MTSIWLLKLIEGFIQAHHALNILTSARLPLMILSLPACANA